MPMACSFQAFLFFQNPDRPHWNPVVTRIPILQNKYLLRMNLSKWHQGSGGRVTISFKRHDSQCLQTLGTTEAG